MTCDPVVSETIPEVPQPISLVNPYLQVRLKSEGDKLLLSLPAEAQADPTADLMEVLQQIKYRLNNSERTWQSGTAVHLIAKDRLVDGRQLQAIAELLKETDLQLKWVCTSRRQTAVAAATAGYSVEQEPLTPPLSEAAEQPTSPLAGPLYLKTTVRSGVEVRHPGTVIILGDLNPGGTAIADGDIFVWGCLRGIAHAGAQGNRDCRIGALRMEPTQLRIANVVARAPAVPPGQFEPEVAYISQEGIRITKAINLNKIQAFESMKDEIRQK